jgi:hypothetical protein
VLRFLLSSAAVTPACWLAAGRRDQVTPAGYDSDGGLNCCTYQGNPCGFDAACCGTAVCIGGVCGAIEPVPGFPLGAQCSYVAQCLGGGDTVDCADNDGFVPVCCLTGGQFCSADIDCCMPNSCIAGSCQ